MATSVLSFPPGNQLLARLPESEYQRLIARAQLVPLSLKQVLYDPGRPIAHVYFPYRGVISVILIMEDGETIEVATIGNEGMAGVAALQDIDSSYNRLFVQVPGEALRLRVEDLQEALHRSSVLDSLLKRYQGAYLMQVSQSAACNGLHSAQQRCCRWLLLAQDRVQADELPLTHEFLAEMLGVRRSTVTEVLRPLQEAGWVEVGRGRVTILNRPALEAAACECYRRVRSEFDRLLRMSDE